MFQMIKYMWTRLLLSRSIISIKYNIRCILHYKTPSCQGVPPGPPFFRIIPTILFSIFFFFEKKHNTSPRAVSIKNKESNTRKYQTDISNLWKKYIYYLNQLDSVASCNSMLYLVVVQIQHHVWFHVSF